jgi:nucleoside-diphosphate-sugar epimerase
MSLGLVAVTGGTGFLGRYVVRELASAGWRVRVLARRDIIHPLWRDIEPELVLGDLADQAALARLCRDADLVVHIAGLIKARSRAAFDATNVEGTRRVARAAASPVLLVSSLAAREPALSPYAASKRQGEAAAREILGDRLTIVRPPAIYGPGDMETLPLFRIAAVSPILPVLDPAARLALIHVEDAASQITAIAGRPRAGQTVTLSDARPQGYSWREIMTSAATAVGTRPRLVRAPSALLWIGAALSGPAASLSFGKVREILHNDWSIGPQEQPMALPRPHFDLASGFLHTVAGYRAYGVILGAVTF